MPSTIMNTTRRSFLKRAAAIAGMPAIIPASALGRDGTTAPSNRIVVGGIGLGPRGRHILGCLLPHADAQFVAIADPQLERREIIRKTVNRHYGNEDCKTYRDLRELLSRDDIDAVLIATGDRWHAPASILAAKAGKDIYCEKPCTMTIAEGRELDEAVTKHQRIFQAGTQRRNVDNFQAAHALAHSGKLGKLHTLHAGILVPSDHRPPLPGEPEPDPEVIDWNLWLGPSPSMPYNKRYVQGQWRHQQGLTCGYNILEWGSHTLDLCQWAAGADDTAPVEYEAQGGTIHARYANGMKLVMRLSGFSNEGEWLGLGSCPVRFEGDAGWVEVGDNGKIAVSDPSLLEKTPATMAGTNASKHVRQFLDCVKSRQQPATHSGVTRHGHLACHAAAIAWKLGRKLRLNPDTETFEGDDEANRMAATDRRAPWQNI
ncbi:MAG: Gfo/Idh/MocA family oxidoreductase, partial [Akkermansiaceae bacterium]|nr:Gfo/Idh/MocA family oxidoreductase [Akkermansiaceae bacterium]